MSAFERSSYIHNPSSLHLFQDKKKPSKEANATTDAQLANVDEMLRSAVQFQAGVVHAPSTVNAPVQQQIRLQQSLGLSTEDKAMGSGPLSTLGDYTTTTNQAESSAPNEATRAMDLQTITSQSDLNRIMQMNHELSSAAGQFNLDQIERKAVKRYRMSGYNTLSQQSYM